MRKKLIIYLLLSTVLTFNLRSQEQQTSSFEQIIYGNKYGLASLMYMAKPKISNGKAIIYVVSGRFSSSEGIFEFQKHFMQPQIDKGYTVFFALHSSTPRFSILEAASDIKRAVQFVRFNANKYGIDPDNIGITGMSSGGNLALIAATSDDIINPNAEDPVEKMSSKVQAAVVFYPPTDFLNFGMPGLTVIQAKDRLEELHLLSAFQFKEFDQEKSIFKEVTSEEKQLNLLKSISPAQLVSADDCPTFLYHGDHDMLIPLQQSEWIKEKYMAEKVPVELMIKKGGGHGWDGVADDYKNSVQWFDKYLNP